MKTIYAIYRGDTFVDVGTAEELSKRMNVTKRTIYYLSGKVYKRRLENRNSRNALIGIVVGKERDLYGREKL